MAQGLCLWNIIISEDFFPWIQFTPHFYLCGFGNPSRDLRRTPRHIFPQTGSIFNSCALLPIFCLPLLHEILLDSALVQSRSFHLTLKGNIIILKILVVNSLITLFIFMVWKNYLLNKSIGSFHLTSPGIVWLNWAGEIAYNFLKIVWASLTCNGSRRSEPHLYASFKWVFLRELPSRWGILFKLYKNISQFLHFLWCFTLIFDIWLPGRSDKLVNVSVLRFSKCVSYFSLPSF